MKKTIALILTAVLLLSVPGCAKKEEKPAEPDSAQMKSICELATMKCYYHNVAKYKEENAEAFLWWHKDKHFWIEYSSVITLGIDAERVNLKIDGDQVEITLPKAKVLDCNVESIELDKDSYIVAQNSVPITAEDEVKAFASAQERLKQSAENNSSLLNEARQRAQMLLRDYICNFGKLVGKNYSIRWIYLDADGAPTGETMDEPAESELSTSSAAD